ncbi:hypothetical protein [Lactobacillus porci]|nr:hypothetical protein [Lactobacillus porci]
MLLDEITANLDALNEGIILKSLKEAAKDKTLPPQVDSGHCRPDFGA